MGRKHWSIASLTAVFGILGLVLLIHAQLQHSGKRALLFVPTPGQGVGFTQHGHAIIGEATAQQLESMAGTFRQLDNSVRASFDEEREGKDGGVANAEIERKWPNAFDEFVVRASPPEQPAAAPGAGQTMLSGACLPGSNTAYSYQEWKPHGCCGTVEHDDNGDVFCTGSAPAAAPTAGAAQTQAQYGSLTVTTQAGHSYDVVYDLCGGVDNRANPKTPTLTGNTCEPNANKDEGHNRNNIWKERSSTWSSGYFFRSVPSGIFPNSVYFRPYLGDGSYTGYAPCPHEGGGAVTLNMAATAYICCANHGTASNVPQTTGVTWSPLSGSYPIGSHSGNPCTFYKATLPAGSHSVCCSSAWATGLFVQYPEPPASGDDFNGPWQTITSGNCITHNLQYVETVAECGRAAAAVGVTQTYNGNPTSGGNRQRNCGTWGGLAYAHFNSATSGVGGNNGYPILNIADTNALQICRGPTQAPTAAPTWTPTEPPTTLPPSNNPTTHAPTEQPTATPSMTPTLPPTTLAPTHAPSLVDIKSLMPDFGDIHAQYAPLPPPADVGGVGGAPPPPISPLDASVGGAHSPPTATHVTYITHGELKQAFALLTHNLMSHLSLSLKQLGSSARPQLHGLRKELQAYVDQQVRLILSTTHHGSLRELKARLLRGMQAKLGSYINAASIGRGTAAAVPIGVHHVVHHVVHRDSWMSHFVPSADAAAQKTYVRELPNEGNMASKTDKSKSCDPLAGWDFSLGC